MIALLLSVASAHHGTTPGQVEPVQERRAVAGDERLSISLGARWSTVAYHTVLRGSKRLDRAESFRLTNHTLTPRIRVGLPTRTGFGLELPTGMVESHVSGERARHVGLGDLTLRADQGLGPVVFGASLSAPTGRRTDQTVSVVDVVTEQGALSLRGFDLRTDLGAGAWMGGAEVGLAGRWQIWRASLGSWVRGSLSETPEAVRWGPTLGAFGRLGVEGEQHTASLTIDGYNHLADRWIDETGPARGGQRVEAGLGIEVGTRIGRSLQCRAGGRLPVIRNVEDTQLVETVRFSLSCTQTTVLDRSEPK